METKKLEIITKSSNVNSIFIEPKSVRKSKDGEYLLIKLEDGRIIRKHMNYFKALMGIAFTPKTQVAAA